MADLATAQPTGAYGGRRERVGWYFYDWANSAFQTSVIAVFLGPYLTGLAASAAGADKLVHPFGIPVSPGSFYAYTVSLSVLLAVVVLPVMGAIADRSRHKRALLATAAYVGSAATIGLVFATGDRYLLGGILFVVANLAYAASVVVYNSFLPQLAEPDRRDTISSVGWAVGYLGGGLLLAIHLVVVLSAGATGDVARWCIVSAGVWWAVFTTVPIVALRDRAPLGAEVPGSVLTRGFRQVGRTFAELRKYPKTLFFLAAYLIYNDGIQTVIALSSVYATDALGLTQTALVPTLLLVQILAFFGALALGRAAGRIGARTTVLVALVLWIVVLLAAFFLPAGQPLLFALLGGGIGFVLGGSQALSRSMFSQLIPAGREAGFFGLYEIADRGTSWMGPLVYGLVQQLTGSFRLAILSMLVFFVVGFILLALVPLRQAIIEAGNKPPRLV